MISPLCGEIACLGQPELYPQRDLIAANGNLVSAHTWGGGEVASADGMRFVVPIRTVHAGPNPKYFGVGS
jgi:TnpA family transposase